MSAVIFACGMQGLFFGYACTRGAEASFAQKIAMALINGMLLGLVIATALKFGTAA